MGQRWGVSVGASQQHAIRTHRSTSWPHRPTVTHGGGLHLDHHVRELAWTRAQMAPRVVHVLAVLHGISWTPQPLLSEDILLRATRDHTCAVVVVQLCRSLRTRPWAGAETWTMAVPSKVVGALAAHGLEKLSHGGVWGKVTKSAHFSQLLGGTGPWHVGSPHAPFIENVVDHVVTVVVVHSSTA